MGPATMKTIEYALAEQVVEALAPGVAAEAASEDGETIRFRLRGLPGWKLVSIVFSRAGLTRLSSDPDRGIKIEYLKKDIARAGKTRREYRYPRLLWSRI